MEQLLEILDFLVLKTKEDYLEQIHMTTKI